MATRVYCRGDRVLRSDTQELCTIICHHSDGYVTLISDKGGAAELPASILEFRRSRKRKRFNVELEVSSKRELQEMITLINKYYPRAYIKSKVILTLGP